MGAAAHDKQQACRATHEKSGPPRDPGGPAFRARRRAYFVEPELLPDEPLLLGLLLLGLLLLGLLLELPPLEEELLGEELLGDELDEPLEPPVAPELEPDLLKYESHSVRETWPSLFVSTLLKLGAELDAPLELLPLDMPELPPLELLGEDELPLELLGEDELSLELGEELEELPPLEAPDEPLLPVVALGEDLSLDAPLEDEPELCAMDTLASANSAAAVAVVISFNFIW